MERNDPGQGFRARAMQLLSWLTGIREQERQQQTQQADRQQWDGYTRGMDDPDNRRQQQTSLQENRQELRARVDAQQQGRTVHTDGPGAAQQTRRSAPDQRLNDAELTAIRERLQAHHRALQQQQQRGQGRGWGG